MGKAMIIAGLLMALLVFGCLGGLKGQQAQAGQGIPGSSAPSKAAGASGVGDSDLSTSEDGTEGSLPGEDLLPPPPDAGASADASGLADELPDSFSDSEEFPELISEDLAVEPI